MSNAKVVANYQKVKTHFRENKKVYIATAAGVVAGAVSVMIFGPSQIVLVDSLKLINWKSNHTSQTIVQLQRRGTLSNFVKDLDTDAIYESQNLAAKALGVSPSCVSQHLRGIRPHLNGHHLTVVGAMPS